MLDGSIAASAEQETILDGLHYQKYRDTGQTREEHGEKLARALATDNSHFKKLNRLIQENKLVTAGRVQAALGSDMESSPFNCVVSGTIEDSMEGIMEKVKEGALTLKLGSGIGYDFSTLRPDGAPIRTLRSTSTGPLSFIPVFDAMAAAIHIKHRRGAQMGVMNIHHPDIMKFITAKMDATLKIFNLSVAVTDEFMKALEKGDKYELRFPVGKNGKVYGYADAREVWAKIMDCAWLSAEPGVLFIDTINHTNNLWYCEKIAATNPCAEQPLPPYGMCLLGSINLAEYFSNGSLDLSQLSGDVPAIIEAYDNIFERSMYALPQHREEALNKRRMGIGMTGIANAIELIGNDIYGLNGYRYGDDNFIKVLDEATNTLKEAAYLASTELAHKRGSFPLYNYKYGTAEFILGLPEWLKKEIHKHGIRNSHLLSYAPCGTISKTAKNVSSGVEPVFYHRSKERWILQDGPREFILEDYNVRYHGVYGKSLTECSIEDHLRVSETIQHNCDSAISKTVNVSPDCTFEEYEGVYLEAYKRGIKGITVYKPNSIRPPVIQSGDCNDGQCKLTS
jgi:ribonucleoside-diphosphate reductase alpha chain